MTKGGIFSENERRLPLRRERGNPNAPSSLPLQRRFVKVRPPAPFTAPGRGTSKIRDALERWRDVATKACKSAICTRQKNHESTLQKNVLQSSLTSARHPLISIAHRMHWLLFAVIIFIKENNKPNMTDPLPVPAQLEAQLGKCRSVRNDSFRKGREKTPQVRGQPVSREHAGKPSWFAS